MKMRKIILLAVIMVVAGAGIMFTQEGRGGRQREGEGGQRQGGRQQGGRQQGGRQGREGFMQALRGGSAAMEQVKGMMIVVSSQTLFLVDLKSFQIKKNRSMLQEVENKGTPRLRGIGTPLIKYSPPYLYIHDSGYLLKYQLASLKLLDYLELKAAVSEAPEGAGKPGRENNREGTF